MKKARPASKIGRKRRTLGWTLLTLGLLVAGVWVWSGWYAWSLDYQNREWASTVYRGCVSRDLTPSASGMWGQWARPIPLRRFPGPEWDIGGFSAHRRRSAITGFSGLAFHIPFWPLPLLLWTPAALLLRSGILARRRANTGACAKCGYSLAGLAADSPCPECGTVLSGAERMKAGSEAARSNGPLHNSDGGTK